MDPTAFTPPDTFVGWLYQFQPLIAGGLAILAAGLGALALLRASSAQISFERAKDERAAALQCRRLALSLAAEIRGLQAFAEEVAKVIVEAEHQNGYLDVEICKHLRHPAPLIYEHAAANIGILPAAVAAEVVQFYLELSNSFELLTEMFPSLVKSERIGGPALWEAHRGLRLAEHRAKSLLPRLFAVANGQALPSPLEPSPDLQDQGPAPRPPAPA